MTRRCLVALAMTTLLFLLLAPVAGSRVAKAQNGTTRLSARMSSYYYLPGDRAHLDVDLELPEEVRTDDITLDFLLYSSAVTRSHLASFREGVRRYPIIRRTLETIAPGAEWTDKMYEVDLQALGLADGVYPFEVRLSQGGGKITSDLNYLVIMEPGGGYPLNLSLLWTLDFLPSTDALGKELDGGLAAACSSSPSETGFLYALAKVVRRTPEVRSSMVLPPSTYLDLEALAGAAEKNGSGDAERGAAEIKAILDEAFRGGQVDLLGTTYAFSNPDSLASQGWEDDAASQMRLGLAATEKLGAKGKGFVAPLFRLSDAMLQRMVENGREFTVVGEEALRASEAGTRLLQGTTLSQPVQFVNSNGYLLKAFLRDEALYNYLESTPQRDASHTVQGIFAELAVLQREKPGLVRSCVLAFPPSFVPAREFLDELYGAVKGCPWLQTRHLSELNQDQFPLEDIALRAPVYPEAAPSYIQKLGTVRGAVHAFTAAIPQDHPWGKSLDRYLLVAENYRFMGDSDAATAQAYLEGIESAVQGEISKVRIEQKRSVTLSSTEGKLSVDITSALDYPLSALLSMHNASLTFPEGNAREVVIEPRENRFIFSVNTHRKGSFIVDIVLETEGLVIDSTSTTVNTSIINTLAIILLACLVAIVALAVALRRLSRKLYGGKHSRGRANR